MYQAKRQLYYCNVSLADNGTLTIMIGQEAIDPNQFFLRCSKYFFHLEVQLRIQISSISAPQEIPSSVIYQCRVSMVGNIL